MHVVPFIADTAAEALIHIQARMGPDAVVLNIRQLPARGISRLWQRARVEVLACAAAASVPAGDPLADLRQEVQELRQRFPHPVAAAGNPEAPQPTPAPAQAHVQVQVAGGIAVPLGSSRAGWRVGSVLEASGFLPLYAQQVVDRLAELHGAEAPDSLSEELTLARAALLQAWKTPPRIDPARPQVLIGPAGAGKTTVLCKWLTQTVLLEGSPARVWRMDGQTANAAQFLDVHGEILGVAVKRWRQGDVVARDGSLHFVDVPGVDWRDADGVKQLRSRLAPLENAQVHLVVNAAYEVALLLAQARAFEAWPLSSLIVTHLDEEPRWGKLWNLVLGTNYGLRFFSAGQNIPGDFRIATPAELLGRQFAAALGDLRVR